MASSRWSRAAIVGAMSAGFAVWHAAAAAAAPLPLRADVRVSRRIDLAAFEQSVALRYDLHFRKIVAADIDRDGDLDVVAATDRALMVWVNDGAGHLTSEPPAARPSVEPCDAGAAWRDQAAPVQEPIQNDLPPVPLPGIYAHAPPAPVASNRILSDPAARASAALGWRTPRAPPA